MKRLLSLFFTVVAGLAFAESTPVMVSLVTPLQVPSSDWDVGGLRLDLIYGQSRDFKGLDIGIANQTTGDFNGIGIGGVNIVGDRMCGGQIGIVNWNSNGYQQWENKSIGLQFGILNNSDSFCGLQDGLVNVSNDYFAGLQVSFLNVANDMNGMQCGGYLIFGVNVATGTVRGCQIGLVNYANRVDGAVQIGLLNFISQGGFAPVFPIVNGSF